jgi:hypothetical protein
VGALPSPADNVPAKWKKYYGRLMRTRDQFLNRKTGLIKNAAEEQPAFSLHMADAGTDSFDRDLALSRVSSEQDLVLRNRRSSRSDSQRQLRDLRTDRETDRARTSRSNSLDPFFLGCREGSRKERRGPPGETRSAAADGGESDRRQRNRGRL